MDCPKCSFTQPDDAAECASCGILFAKLQPRVPRFTRESPLPAERSNAPVFIILAAVFIFGMIWMAHRRRTRDEPAIDLDALNHQQVQLQVAARARDAAEQRNAVAMQVREAHKLPSGLTNDSIIDAITRCPAFRNPTATTLRRVGKLGNYSTTEHSVTIAITWEQFATDDESRVLASGDATATFEGGSGFWHLRIIRDDVGKTLCE